MTRRKPDVRTGWGILWRSDGRLDGKREHLIGRMGQSGDIPDYMKAYRTMAFETRREARAWIARTHGYIRRRRDLRVEPHGWKMPIPVRIKIVVIVVERKDRT